MKVIYSTLNDQNVLCKKVIKNIYSIDFCDDHIVLFKIINGVPTSIGFIYFSDVLSIENF
jgi:hypothetical protein